MEKIEELIRDLKFKLNAVCYEEAMIEKLSSVWDSFNNLESEFELLNLNHVSKRSELLKFLSSEITKTYKNGDIIHDGKSFINSALKNFNSC